MIAYRRTQVNKRALHSATRLAARLCILAIIQATPSYAETLWDVKKLVSANTVVDDAKPIALRDDNSVGYVRVNSLKTLLEAHKRLSQVSNVNADLAVIVDKKPNAHAFFGERLVVVTTGMLDSIGTDPDMVAAVVGHELAHLSLRHAVQRVLNVPNIVYGGVGVATAVSQRSGDYDRAIRVGSVAMALIDASFSRQQEAEADKVGAEFQAKAQYNPDGSVRLFNTFIKLGGSKTAGYLDTHPGLEDRVKAALPLAANLQKDAIAAQFVEKRNWKALAKHVEQWLKASPDDSNAWYYQGIALNRRHRAGSLAAFRKAIEFNPIFHAARLELCVELYRLGNERESLTCAEYLPLNDVKEAYEARTFQHSVFTGGFAPQVRVSASDAQIINSVMATKGQAQR